MKRLIGLLCLAAALLPWPATAEPVVLVRATPGYLYFNRPGADMARHDSELRDCIESWDGGHTTHTIAPDVKLVPYVVYGVMLDKWDKARYAANVEHCMVIRGWRVVRVDPAEGARLAALDPSVLSQTLASWVGASNPPGQVVRVWGNEAALPDTVLIGDPQGVTRTLLSEIARRPDAPLPEQRVWSLSQLPQPELLPGVMKLKFLSPLKNLASPPLDQAIFVVRMTGDERHKRGFLDLDRSVGGAWTGQNWQPGDWTVLNLSLGKRPSKVGDRLEVIEAFAAPPGRWRVYGASVTFDYCMGAPGFDAKAGDVIFLGSFDFSRAPIKPDLDLAPVKSFLEAAPGLAERIRPAGWVNGDTWPCRSDSPYALEFPGFPYKQGYGWGAAAPRP